MAEPEGHTLLEMFRIMTTIKQCDEKFRSLVMSGQAMIAYYSPRGQEAISAAVSVSLQPSDYVVTTYRGLHDQVAKGVPLGNLMAEYLGRATGTCKGKGGGMHVTHPDSGLMVTTGIVGGGLPIANGLALAAKLQQEDRVTVCNFGDGASNIGAFHEALNLASVWNLPIVFVCQNNGYAEHTPLAKGTSQPVIARRADAYGMPGATVNGNDPVAMYAAAATAISRARSGGGPTLVEATTYRFMGHYFGDDMHYMPKDELAAAQADDPLVTYRAWLVDNGHATDEELTGMEKEAALAIDEAAEYALGSPFPDVAEVCLDVYAKEVPV